MITWMLLALVATVLLAGAATALERAVHLLRRPRRWGWLAAMLVAVGLPLLFRLLPAEPAEPAGAGPVDPALLAEILALAPAAQTEAGILDRVLQARSADPVLLSLWLALTVALVLAIGVAYRRLDRVRARGVRIEIAGVPALLTDATGPVVVGVSRPEIVLPRWIDTLSEEERRLVIRHEWEHVRAGDPRLLMVAALLVAAMPWNLPLWWMRARLRQALEMDCDARVLASGADRRTYGTMLIQTAGRPGPAPLLAPALVELPSLLERRIFAMTGRIPAHRRVRIAAASAFGALLFVVACEMTPRGSAPSPTEPDLADVIEPEPEGVSERVVIRMMTDDSTAGRVLSRSISPDGDVTIIRVGPDGDTTEIRDMRIRLSPLDEFERDGVQPLYIVDGERVESIEGLDPSRIVTIDVVKGPMAVERFGAGAANGVVQIHTGEPGEAVRLPLRESTASAQREEVLEIARDGVGVRIEDREPGESRVNFFNPDNPDARPLIIVDGKRGSIEGLDPARIETIEVIKDPAATAGYGPEARDGVIIVKTRQVAPARVRMPAPPEAPVRLEADAMSAPATPVRVAAGPRPVEVVASEVAALAAAAPAAPVPVAAREAEVARVSARAEAIAASAAEPLVIVEGEVVPSLAELHDRFPPETIESVTVLKDRSATEAYGERGRNGVIIVELKD